MLIFSCYLDYNSEQITQNIYCESQKRYSFATKKKIMYLVCRRRWKSGKKTCQYLCWNFARADQDISILIINTPKVLFNPRWDTALIETSQQHVESPTSLPAQVRGPIFLQILTSETASWGGTLNSKVKNGTLTKRTTPSLIESACTLNRRNAHTKEQDKLSGILAKAYFPNEITGSSTGKIFRATQNLA